MNLLSSSSHRSVSGIVLAAALAIGGCSGRASLLPNSDPDLRKTSTEFAVDAVHRFPYKAGAPQAGDAVARAEIAYMYKRIEIVNLSSDEMEDVELWINQQYVVHVPKMTPHVLVQIPFQMFYDDQGHYFPKENSNANDSLVHKVELLMDGKMYNVPVQLPDH